MKTESRYKKKLTTESCFYLHKILDSVKEILLSRNFKHVNQEVEDGEGTSRYQLNI